MSYYQLADIYRVAQDEEQQNAQAVPEACPNDGEPLKDGPDGELYCPFDGWRPNGRHVSDGHPGLSS